MLTIIQPRQQQQDLWATLDEYELVIAPLVFTALAFFTRMYKIGLSNVVTWDEAQYVLKYWTTSLSQLLTDRRTALENLDRTT